MDGGDNLPDPGVWSGAYRLPVPDPGVWLIQKDTNFSNSTTNALIGDVVIND